jgi:hypothetical protein
VSDVQCPATIMPLASAAAISILKS